MTAAEAVAALRKDPHYSQLIRDSYLDEDVVLSAKRFAASAEIAEVHRILGASLDGARIADIGAGRGLAALTFARNGAAAVYAVEPDSSPDVGYGALQQLRGQLPIAIVAAFGEALPFSTASMDIVYVRQALHHARDLRRFVLEVARVLKPGGLLLATREHVVADETALEEFLTSHPLHSLTGGECAYRLAHYHQVFAAAGFRVLRTWGPWDTVVNAFPAAHSEAELDALRRRMVDSRLGRLAWLWPLRRLVWHRVSRPFPGAAHSFLARLGRDPVVPS